MLKLDFAWLDDKPYDPGADKEQEKGEPPLTLSGTKEELKPLYSYFESLANENGDKLYREYLHLTQEEILKGIGEGRNACRMLVTASKAIAIITEDAEFYGRIKEYEASQTRTS
ncbi:MAG: hypothetical protein FWG10_10785 [Eubacteriaceae bacterium]|nr:hypothetical protein [Eubacteriaceae bacterium]